MPVPGELKPCPVCQRVDTTLEHLLHELPGLVHEAAKHLTPKLRKKVEAASVEEHVLRTVGAWWVTRMLDWHDQNPIVVLNEVIEIFIELQVPPPGAPRRKVTVQ